LLRDEQLAATRRQRKQRINGHIAAQQALCAPRLAGNITRS
jgi:hypothetical protein